MRIWILFGVLLLAGGQALSQITPAEGDTLNYLIVGFSFPAIKNTKAFKVQIARGNFNKENTFDKNIVEQTECSETRVIIRVPAFNAQYTWRVVPVDHQSGRKAESYAFHHFTTGFAPDIDTAVSRLRVEQNATEYKSGFVMLDGTRIMYDMSGKPVWYLPDMHGLIKSNSQVRDLKLSCKNTITFLMDGRAFEIDYRGHVLWEGPKGRKRLGDTLEGYHHELTRLTNGHYMALAVDPLVRPKVKKDSTGRILTIDSVRRRFSNRIHQRYGTVVEYDRNENLVWEWKSAKYFEKMNMDFYRKTNGIPEFDVHENSFFFDEKRQLLYVSFRNISQVLKISYPSGEVLEAYGVLKTPSDSMERHLFCGQHSVNISDDGNLFVFDNSCGTAAVPHVVVMKEQPPGSDTLTVVWDFMCPVDPMPPDTLPANNAVLLNRRYSFSSGGNVIELPGKEFFVSTSVPHNLIFIVSPQKEILWRAVSEKWRAEKNAWVPYANYRASIIPDPGQLKDLIWNSSR